MLPTRSLSLVLVLLGTLGLLPIGGCSAGEEPPPAAGAPGAGAYDHDIHCTADPDCNKGESCTNGLCQMKRCGAAGLAKAVSPIRSTGFMVLDRELIVAQGSDVLGYDAKESSFFRSPDPTWNLAAKIVDLASGRLTGSIGSRAETFVVAHEGSSSLTLKQGTTALAPIALGFVPIAVAAGDTHQDGIDRIVATDAAGTFAICNATTNACERLSLGVGGVSDVAVGDIDGDGYSEVLFAVGAKIVVYHYDGGKIAPSKTFTSSTGRNLTRITAGDLDGDGIDEVIGLEDGNDNDIVHVMTIADGSFTVKSSTNVSPATLDLAVGGLGGEVGLAGEVVHVVTIGAANAIEVLDGKEDGTLAYGYQTTLGSGVIASRVAFSDLDGNSVPAVLMAPPKAVSGSLVPLAVLTPPPYSKTHSGEGGGAHSVITVESAATKGGGSDGSVSLSVGAGLSFGGGIGKGLSGSIGVHVGWGWTKSHSASHNTTVSQSFTFEARPDLDGYETGAVAVGCGCFNRYDYQIDDPSGLLSNERGSGTFSIYIPIGGQTALWSLKRYNQLAAALKGELPAITTTQTAGDLSSYPATLRQLGGEAIAREDMLFPEPPSFRISEVGTVNFALSMGEGSSEGDSSNFNKSVNGNLSAFGFSVSGEAGQGTGSGYSVSVGKSTTFIGNVPPVRDQPNTPEDEFALYGYSFTPGVYRAHYATTEKKDAGYFVVTYAVGP